MLALELGLGCGGVGASPSRRPDPAVGGAFLESAAGSEARIAGARGVDPRVLADSAVVNFDADGTLCAELIVRTPADLDRPLEAWDMTLAGLRVYADPERVRAVEYVGNEAHTLVEDLPRTAFAGAALPPVRPHALRVIERRARVCGPVAERTNGVELTLEVRGADAVGWFETFRL